MKIIEFIFPGIKRQEKLNAVIWQDSNTIRPEVKDKLLEIAEHFREYVEVDFPIVDIVITGGQTGRFYTEHSDIDLHLITDYDKIDCDEELEELFDTKRKLYKQEYDIKIKNIPVELYVEDIKKPAVGGSYSIMKDKWIKPSTDPNKDIDQEKIKQQSEQIAGLLKKILKSNDLENLTIMKDQIWQYRRNGLAKEGEFGTANLVFKTLRNSGLLGELLEKIKQLKNQSLSLRQ